MILLVKLGSRCWIGAEGLQQPGECLRTRGANGFPADSPQIANQLERRPVVGRPPRRFPAHRFLSCAQRLRRWHPLFQQVLIEAGHKLRSGLVFNRPQAREYLIRPGGKKSLRKPNQSFAALILFRVRYGNRSRLPDPLADANGRYRTGAKIRLAYYRCDRSATTRFRRVPGARYSTACGRQSEPPGIALSCRWRQPLWRRQNRAPTIIARDLQIVRWPVLLLARIEDARSPARPASVRSRPESNRQIERGALPIFPSQTGIRRTIYRVSKHGQLLGWRRMPGSLDPHDCGCRWHNHNLR